LGFHHKYRLNLVVIFILAQALDYILNKNIRRINLTI